MHVKLRASAIALVLGAAIGLTSAQPALAVTGPSTGDSPAATAPRPPDDSGQGASLTRGVFANPDGTIACRRVYTEMVWLECLLKRTNEVVRFGPDESWVEVACAAPHDAERCRLAFGAIYVSPATKSTAARFAGAKRIPLERQVQLGNDAVPYPTCIADPNLGLRCRTRMDDSVGEEIIFGLAGSIWNCPGYESSPGTAEPRGGDRCRVVRP